MAAKDLFRLGVELSVRKIAMEAASDENEIAYRAADLAMLFHNNLDLVIKVLKGETVGLPDVNYSSLGS